MKLIKDQKYRFKKDFEDINSKDWLKHTFEYVGNYNHFKAIYDFEIKQVGKYKKGDLLRLTDEGIELAREPKTHLPVWW